MVDVVGGVAIGRPAVLGVDGARSLLGLLVVPVHILRPVRVGGHISRLRFGNGPWLGAGVNRGTSLLKVPDVRGLTLEVLNGNTRDSGPGSDRVISGGVRASLPGEESLDVDRVVLADVVGTESPSVGEVDSSSVDSQLVVVSRGTAGEPLSFALIGVRAFFPHVEGDVDLLLVLRVDLEGVLGTTIRVVSKVLVVGSQEVGKVHLRVVDVDDEPLESLEEVVNVHEEDTIVSGSLAGGSGVLLSPSGVVITPRSNISFSCLPSPRVSDLTKSGSIRKSDSSEKSVLMVVGETEIVQVRISQTLSVLGQVHHGVLTVVLDDKLPDIFGSLTLESVLVSVGSTNEGLDSGTSISRNEGLVVSVVLGESLLEDRLPHRSIVSDVGILGVVPLAVSGEELVDNDGSGDTERVELQGVDTSLVEVVDLEHVVDSLGNLSNSRGSSVEPAVANRSLVNIVRVDTIVSPDGVGSLEPDFLKSLPVGAVVSEPSAVGESRPGKGFLSGESIIVEMSSSSKSGRNVSSASLDSVVSRAAKVFKVSLSELKGGGIEEMRVVYLFNSLRMVSRGSVSTGSISVDLESGLLSGGSGFEVSAVGHSGKLEDGLFNCLVLEVDCVSAGSHGSGDHADSHASHSCVASVFERICILNYKVS